LPPRRAAISVSCPGAEITVHQTIDVLIGAWCIENRRPLLHNDTDFHPMARHLGLLEVPVTA